MTEYDELLKRAAFEEETLRAEGYSNWPTLIEDLAAAITDLQQQVREARGMALEESAEWHDAAARNFANVRLSASRDYGMADRATAGYALNSELIHKNAAQHLRALKDKQPADASSGIAAIFNDLAAKQKPLDAEVARAINENLEGLYEP